MGGQPESRLSLNIQRAMKARGAYVWKVHGNEYTPAGTPDIVGAFRGQAIGVETKMPGNTLSVVQEYRIGKMRQAGYYIVAPCYSIAEALAFLDSISALFDHDAFAPAPGRPSKPTQRDRDRMTIARRLRATYGVEAGFPR